MLIGNEGRAVDRVTFKNSVKGDRSLDRNLPGLISEEVGITGDNAGIAICSSEEFRNVGCRNPIVGIEEDDVVRLGVETGSDSIPHPSWTMAGTPTAVVVRNPNGMIDDAEIMSEYLHDC